MKKLYPLVSKLSLLLFSFCFFATAYTVEAQITYYSYQSGDWNDPSTWTQDPSGLVIDNPGVPLNNDKVVILINRTVRLNTNVVTTGHSITVENGGVLDFVTFTITPLTTLSGTGRLRFNHSYFPAVTTNNFVTAAGGTVEYYDFNGVLPTNQLTYRNLVLSNTNAANDYGMILANPSAPTTYTLNGTLRLRSTQGKDLTLTLGNTAENIINLNIGNAASSIPGNLRIGVNTLLNVGNYTFTPVAGAIDKTHQITINGNLENNGRIDLTNALQYRLATTGAATVIFTGATDNTITSPEPSLDPSKRQLDFYRLVVNKGTDQTYILDVNPQDFSLWAPTQPANGSVANPYSALNPEIRKALWIRSGTLKLGNNINIPKLADAEDINGSGTKLTSGNDFFIPLNGALWIDGATVAITDPLETGENIGAHASRTTMTIIGKFRITSGTFNGNKGAGFIYRNTGEILIEGGTINISQFRISVDKTTPNRSSYVQTGGTFTVRGNTTMSAEIEPSYALFSILDPASTFQMSGGVLNIMDNANNSGGNFLVNANYDNENINGLFIKSAASNTNVTGGTVNITLNSNDQFRASSTAPLYAVNISRYNAAGNANVTVYAALTVKTNLAVNANAVLNTIASADLIVGGNLTINANAQYNPVTNNTILNGTSDQNVVLNGVNPVFYNLTVQTQGTTTFSGNNPTVQNTLTINSGSTFNDGGLRFTLDGGAGSGVSNSGIHTGTGRIELKGVATQSISGFDGSFKNLLIDNANSVAMAGNHTITGELRLVNGIVDVSIHKLTLGADAKIYDGATGTGAVFSSTKMIRTAGNRSDEGVSAIYDPVKRTEFTFPVGVFDNGASVNKYTPVTIQAASTGNYGSIIVRPVNREHPNVSNIGQSLKYYWRVTQSGWTGVITATHKNYTYTTTTPDDRQGTLTAYRAARFDQGTSSWKYAGATFNATSSATTVIPNFNTNTFTPAPGIGSIIEGEFTAGDQAAFGGITVYYSYKNGDWSDINTWSTTGHTGAQTLPAVKPGTNAVVKINNGHMVTVTTTGGERSGSLFIGPNSTLDLTTTRGNDFGTLIGEEAVGGTGTLRISSASPETTAQFPAGDFGEFIGSNGGTVEYYTNADDFTLPATYKDNGSGIPQDKPLNRYRNLVMNAGAGRNIWMPNNDLTIYNNLTVGSTPFFTGNVRISDGVSGNFTVENDLIIANGILQLPGSGSNNRNITVNRNVNIGTGSFLTEDAGGRVHTLIIGDNLINNNVFDMHPGATSVTDVTFIGDTNAEISGTGTTTDFNQLIVNKGNSQTPVLDVKGSSFTFRSGLPITDVPSPLVLSNGTFRLTTNTSITLSANTTVANNFTIQQNARLSANGGIINIGYAASDNADLALAGTLEVLSGTVNIGDLANNNNNDIEYSAASSPVIDVQGGTLIVNGQIRRSTGSELGVLIYNQSNGQVTINGRNQVNNRAKLEIEGANSAFNMSGGTLTLVRGGGTTYGDIYLRPGISTVTGGTILLSSGTAGNQTYRIDAGIPLFNLTITGAVGNTATTQLLVSPLVLKGNLTITNTSSSFIANNLNVSVGGNFINAGAYTPGLNTTIFNGDKAQIATFNAATTFYNLTIDKPSVTTPADNVVTFESTSVTKYNPTVSNTLNISSGVLENGQRIITVNGDITNNGTHRSSDIGKIVMTSPSTSSRTILGTGAFGRLDINDMNDVLVQGTISINTELILNNGFVNIEDKLLTFGPAATITGAGATKHIRTNGVLSDLGVRRLYNAGAGNFAPFIWPIGSPSGYTPAQISGNATMDATASITVKPVDARHPATRAAANSELLYFWNVSSTGFSNVTNAQHQYTYLDGMIQGTEASYVPGRFDETGFWIYGTQANMNNAANTIGNTTFSTNGFTKPGSPANTVHYINGDYTAGYAAEFGIVPTYYSRNATAGTNPAGANWSDNTTWSTTGHNGNAIAIGEFPNGAPVIIASNHIVIAADTNRYAASLDLGANSMLNLGNQPGHNLGEVKGTGTIQIEATSGGSLIYPGGDYTAFVKAGGGTFIYKSDIAESYVFPQNDSYKYNHVVFIGTGKKIMAPADVEIKGDWNAVGGQINFPEEGTETVTLSGTSQQINIFTPVTYNGVNTSGVILNGLAISGGGNKNLTEGNIFINRKLSLGNGYLVTATDPVEEHVITLADTATIIGGSVSSFVSGPLAHIGIGTKFFPVGDITKAKIYRPVILNDIKGIKPTIQAQHFDYSPLGIADFTTGITNISDIRHWQIELTSGTFAGASGTFAYDPVADKAYYVNASQQPVFTPSELRMAKTFAPDNNRNGLYKNIGSSSGADAVSAFGTNNLSSITSDEFNSFSFFALASINQNVNPLPVRLLYVKAKQVNKTVVIDWATASEINNDHFEVERSVDGKNFEYIGRVQGNGTVQTMHTYNYVDAQLPNTSILYYRLRQVDTDGKHEMSEIVAVQITSMVNEVANRWSVYPNPLRGDELEIVAADANFKSDEVYTFRLYHISGQLITVQTATVDAAVKELRRALTGASAGLYLLQIDSSRGRDLFKLLKQ